jgi:hypothetical protein
MTETFQPAERALCERMFAQALQPVASELRLVDLDALLHHVRAGEHASIADLVASCAEPYFAPGALDFALGAQGRACWEQGSCVALDLEFSAPPLTAFLRLALGARGGGVELLGLHAPGREGTMAAAVAAAIGRARLVAHDEPAFAFEDDARSDKPATDKPAAAS